MAFAAKDILDIIDRVDQYAQQARDAMQEAMPGQPLGAVRATDEEAAAMVLQMQAKDPNYILALPYVDGGMELLAQFERVYGLRVH